MKFWFFKIGMLATFCIEAPSLSKIKFCVSRFKAVVLLFVSYFPAKAEAIEL